MIEKGIIRGVLEPSSLSKRFQHLTYYLMEKLRALQRKVVFLAISFQIQAIHNYSIFKSDPYDISTEFMSKIGRYRGDSL